MPLIPVNFFQLTVLRAVASPWPAQRPALGFPAVAAAVRMAKPAGGVALRLRLNAVQPIAAYWRRHDPGAGLADFPNEHTGALAAG